MREFKFSLSNANTAVTAVAVRFIFLDSQFLRGFLETRHNRSLLTALFLRWGNDGGESCSEQNTEHQIHDPLTVRCVANERGMLLQTTCSSLPDGAE